MQVTFQHDTMQCGIACLKMICRHFGKEVSLSFLSKMCSCTNEGTSLLSISEAASTIGLKTASYKLSIYDLRKIRTPCILYWNQNHFVVLYKIVNNKRYFIADPAKGRLLCGVKELETYWTYRDTSHNAKGIVMCFYPTKKFYLLRNHSSVNGNEHSLKFLFGYVNKYHRYFGQVLLGLLLSSILQLVLPFLTQAIVDVGIKNENIGFIWLILLCQRQRRGGGPCPVRDLLSLTHFSYSQLMCSLHTLIDARLVSRTHTGDGTEVYTLNRDAGDLGMGTMVEAILGRKTSARQGDDSLQLSAEVERQLEDMLQDYLTAMDSVKVEEIVES